MTEAPVKRKRGRPRKYPDGEKPKYEQKREYPVPPEEKVPSNWDFLQADIVDLDIPPKVKTVILNLLEQRYSGKTIYVRERDVTRKKRMTAIMAMINAHMTRQEIVTAVANRFRLERNSARRLVKRAFTES